MSFLFELAAMSLMQEVRDLLSEEWLEENPTAPLKGFPRAEVLAELKRQYTASDYTIMGNAFDICAFVIEDDAGAWIRELAQEPIPNLLALPFFRALAHCVGEDGFAIATKKLDAELPQQVAMTAHALLAFDSPGRILDWIVTYIDDRQPPITKAWGQLAALAGIDWRRMEMWLERDKRAGLIAIDALHCYLDHDVGEGGWLFEREPRLAETVDQTVISGRLEAFAQAHPTPRITRTVDHLLAYLG